MRIAKRFLKMLVLAISQVDFIIYMEIEDMPRPKSYDNGRFWDFDPPISYFSAHFSPIQASIS